MNFENLKKGTYLVVLSLCVTLIVYLFMKHVFLAVLPFLIGWFVAFAIRPLAARLSGKVRIRASILRVILTILLTLTLIGSIALGVWAVSREVWRLLSTLGEGDGALYSIISDFMSSEGLIGRIFGEFAEYVADGIYKLVISLLGTLAGFLSSLAMAVPKALFFALITVISAIYFAHDLEKINASVKRILPARVFSVAVRLKDGFLCAFAKYIRSYAILLAITFVEMLVGLFALRAPYPLLMAALIAVLDLLPVIGVGTVLIPWGVWSFFGGKGGFGVGLLILFVLHTVLRQMLEPRIVGKNLGVHPLLTLVFLYTGYVLFGFVGLILVPVFTVLVNVCLGKDNAAEID